MDTYNTYAILDYPYLITYTHTYIRMRVHARRHYCYR